MKKLLFIPLLFLALTLSAQQTPNAMVTLSTLTDLRAFPPGQTNEIVSLQGITTATDQNGGMYFWNASSVITDDGFVNIQVTGITTGRWQRMLNNNTLKLNISITPVVLQTAYPVSYGVTLPAIPVDIQVQSTSANGALFNYTTSKTTTGFTLNFASVPIGVCTFDILVIKQ